MGKSPQENPFFTHLWPFLGHLFIWGVLRGLGVFKTFDRFCWDLKLRQDGHSLRWAADALKADREIVQTAVQQDWRALYCAADMLLDDPDFATEARSRHLLLKAARSYCLLYTSPSPRDRG
eukprot:3648559-Amphidinium_carterae.2